MVVVLLKVDVFDDFSDDIRGFQIGGRFYLMAHYRVF
jgi:hypothetical protein